jgi:hypothetical protein
MSHRLLKSPLLVAALSVVTLHCTPVAPGPADAGPDAGETQDAGQAFAGHNNVAVLTGEPVGDGLVANEDIRKQLTIGTVSGPLRVDEAWVSQPLPNVDNVYAFLKVTNVTERAWCHVVGRAKYLSADGEVVFTGGSMVTGSVGDLPGGRTMTCLAPGEQGWVLDLHGSDAAAGTSYQAITRVDYASDSVHPVPTDPPGKVIAIAYSVPGNPALEITMRNEGPGRINLTGLGRTHWLLLDDEDAPLYWGVLTAAGEPLDGVLDAGQTGFERGTWEYFQGLSTRLEVRTHWSDEE